MTNVVSDNRSDPERQSQSNIVENLTQAYLPNTKKSPLSKAKIAELTENMLTGGLSANTVKENAESNLRRKI